MSASWSAAFGRLSSCSASRTAKAGISLGGCLCRKSLPPHSRPSGISTRTLVQSIELHSFINGYLDLAHTDFDVQY